MAGKKGQIWSYDILAAVVVFIIMFGFLAFFWWSVAATTGEPSAEMISREAKALSGALMSPGSPANWNDSVNASNTTTWSGFSTLGLAEGFGASEISADKAEKMAVMGETDYELLKLKLRTNYNFQVELMEFYNCRDPAVSDFCTAKGMPVDGEEWNSTEHFAEANGRNISFGIGPDAGGALTVSSISRYALYNGSLAKLKVVLWTNQSWQ